MQIFSFPLLFFSSFLLFLFSSPPPLTSPFTLTDSHSHSRSFIFHSLPPCLIALLRAGVTLHRCTSASSPLTPTQPPLTRSLTPTETNSNNTSFIMRRHISSVSMSVSRQMSCMLSIRSLPSVLPPPPFTPSPHRLQPSLTTPLTLTPTHNISNTTTRQAHSTS